MTAQLVQAPIRSGRTVSAGTAVALYLWFRFHRGAIWFALAWFAVAAVDRCFFAGQFHRFLSPGTKDYFTTGTAVVYQFTVIILPIMGVLTPILLVCAGDDHAWILPIRTQALIGWLTLYGAVASTVCWFATVALIWTPAGIHLPLFWPVAMLIAVQCAAFCCRSFTSHMIRLGFVSLVPIALATAGPIAGIAGVPGGIIGAAYLLLCPPLFFLAVADAAHSRRGEVWFAARAPRLRTIPKNEKPFTSAQQAQAWMETHSERGAHQYIQTTHRWMLTGIVTYTSLFFMAAFQLFTGSYTNPVFVAMLLGRRGFEIYASTPWVSAAPITPIILIAVLAPFLTALLPDKRESNGAPAAFIASRPISSIDWIGAKVRACSVTAATVWAAQIPLILIWLLTPALMHGKRMRLGEALFSVMNVHGALLLIALFLGVIFLTWKYLADGLFLIFAGRSKVSMFLVSLSMFAPILVMINVIIQPPSMSSGAIVTVILTIGAPLKLALTAAAVSVSIKRRLLSAATLRRILALWTGTALLFFALFAPALAPYHIAWWQTALGVMLMMPGVRFALAPLALAWDRSH